MSGMEPMLIGAAIGGGISAARGGNPLTGALLGGITGGVGRGLWGAAGSAASNAATTGLSTAGGTLAPTLGAELGAGGAAIGNSVGLAAPTSFSGYGLLPAETSLAAGDASLAAPSSFSGVGVTSAATPSFMDKLKQMPGAAVDWVKANPQSALQGASLLNDMHHTNRMQMPGASPILHGQAPQQNDMYLASLLQGQRQPVSLI